MTVEADLSSGTRQLCTVGVDFFYNVVGILIVHIKFNPDSNPWEQTIYPCKSRP